MIIIPSIASADQLHIGEQLKDIGLDNGVHIDIEDGNFVPNISFGMKTVKAISKVYKGEKDAHLFVNCPIAYIEELVACGIDRIAFQIEAEMYPARTLNRIRSKGGKAGVGINMNTPISTLEMFVDLIDYIIVMTSEPDDMGEKYNARSPMRIAEVRKAVLPGTEIWVDGGISAEQIGDVIKAGADRVIMGREVFTALDPAARLKELEATARLYTDQQSH